jgi:Mg-chelatase subunit ChlI
LYIDEVNLLDDHVVDLLLDSAAMGINVVEREGISFSHPARFILVGTMNPEEGDLRPQLLDRFALSVEVVGIAEPATRMEILQRHLMYETNAEQFRAEWQASEDDLGQRIAAARALVDDVRYSKRDLFQISALTSGLHIDGHRADLVILKTARAHAAFEGRTFITSQDILLATELAIPHRLKRGPFADAQVSMSALSNQLQQLQQQYGDGDDDMQGQTSDQNADDSKKKANR